MDAAPYATWRTEAKASGVRLGSSSSIASIVGARESEVTP